MIITEQWVKRHRRYFRGENSNKPRMFKEFYVTAHSSYAFLYAGKYGKITEYRLKENANIFNMKCATDEGALRRYIQEPKNDISIFWLNFIDSLKDNDWSGKLGSDALRQNLIDIIKELGYDGYFNFEYDEELIKSFWRQNEFRINYTHRNQPGIAFFNKDALVEVESWSGKKLINSDFYKDLHQKELQAIFDQTWNIIDDPDTLIRTPCLLAKGFITMPTTNDVVNATLNEIDYNEERIQQKKETEVNRRKGLLEVMISRMGYSKSIKEDFTEEDYKSEELFREKMRQVTHFEEETLIEEQIQKLRKKFGC